MNALEEKQKVLAAHSVFSHLPVDDLAKIADTAAIISYAPDDIIFRTGDEASCMYIVTAGEIAIQKSEDYVASTEIARLVAGDSFGELDMIAGTARTVMATAATELTVIRFPPEPDLFRGWLEKNPRNRIASPFFLYCGYRGPYAQGKHAPQGKLPANPGTQTASI